MYSDGASEEVTGRALKDLARREDVVVATKVFNPMGPGPNERGLSRKHILDAIDASLRRLQIDYVDLYQTTASTRDADRGDARRARRSRPRGKVRYLGASSTDACARFAQALRVRLHAEPLQPRLPRGGARDASALPAEGIGVIPWSPLARGLLAGTRRPGHPGRHVACEDGRVRPHASTRTPTSTSSSGSSRWRARRGVPPARIALAWLLSRPA